MTLNFTMLAQNTEVDYVTQASLAAMSIHKSNPGSKVSLITNDPVLDKYKQLFDEIIEIPWGDHATNEEWKISNRWKIIHASPYDKSIILDTDVLILDNLSKYWNFMQTYNLFYTSSVINYRGRVIGDNFFRKHFNKFDLPNIYCVFSYFRKCEESFYFYKWLEYGLNNWEKFQGEFAGGKYHQKVASVDLTTAIVTKILGNEKEITSSYKNAPTVTHMKTPLQGWKKQTATNWQDIVGVYLNNNCELKIGNYRQRGVFHYTEDNFVNNSVLKTYETALGI
jgi:hypothetical protein